MVDSIKSPSDADDSKNSFWLLKTPQGWEQKFLLKSLNVDEWDRFHGRTLTQIPFVLMDGAQEQLFDAMDSFDDDSLTFRGVRYPLASWLGERSETEESSFWNGLYQSAQDRWDLKGPSPILQDLLPRLKIPKARVLVLGSGPGHDAAFFAEHGHLVTAVDFSTAAMAQARRTYSQFNNISWHENDIFQLPTNWMGQFDLVFEHTCYCAINPTKRNQLVKIWRQLLAPKGHLLASFFVFENPLGPPFGSSEWELRERLQKYFQLLFWGRWRNSTSHRQGQELAVYAQKKDLL